MNETLQWLWDAFFGSLPKLFGVSESSLIWMLVQAIPLAAVFAWIALKISRAMKRRTQAKIIRQTRATSPNATLILVADFEKEDPKAGWGDALRLHLRDGFPVMAAGGAVEICRWSKRYGATEDARAARRAERDLEKFGADLILWGEYAKGSSIDVTILPSTSRSGAIPPRVVHFDTSTEGSSQRLTERMCIAISFFATEAAGRLADVATVPSVALVSLAEKLTTLVNAPPPGLDGKQLAEIAAAFDKMAFAAAVRAYPPEIVSKTLLKNREKRAVSEPSDQLWIKWAEAAIVVGRLIEEVSQIMGGVQKRDPKCVEAKVLWASALNAERDPRLAEPARAISASAAQEASTDELRAGALIQFARANCTLANRAEVVFAHQLLENAVKAASEACGLLKPSSAWDWLWAHDTLNEANRKLQGSDYPVKDEVLEQRALEACKSGLDGLSSEFAPRPTVILLLTKVQTQIDASLDREAWRGALTDALECARLIPKTSAARRWAVARSMAALAARKLAAIDEDLSLAEDAILLATQAATINEHNPEVASDAWNVEAEAQLVKGAILMARSARTDSLDGRPYLAEDARLALERAIKHIDECVLPHRSLATHPLINADAIAARGQAKRYLTWSINGGNGVPIADLKTALEVNKQRGRVRVMARLQRQIEDCERSIPPTIQNQELWR